MIKAQKHSWRQKIWRLLLVVMAMALIPQSVFAQTTSQVPSQPNKPFLDYTDIDNNYYDPRGNNVCGSQQTTINGGDAVTKFLQALAKQESGGNPHGPVSAGGAHGKYQYIDGTWRSSAKAYYPPASQYDHADQAPEEVQDAVAYIEYSVKFKQFNSDLFKLAVSHFYPAANTNPALLDVIPPKNVITPRQYAEAVIAKINSGYGSTIPIKAAQAPDFAQYLAKAGVAGGNPGSGTPSGFCANNNGVVSGDVVKTAIDLAWDTPGHGKNYDNAKPEYQKAMPIYNGSKGDDEWSDCGVFVATVMVASGADQQYQRRGTSAQMSYIQKHPEKFDFYTTSDYTQSSSRLQPGDILIRDGHTYLFTGPRQGGDHKTYNSVSGSLHDHVPEITNWYPGFNVARVKQASKPLSGAQ